MADIQQLQRLSQLAQEFQKRRKETLELLLSEEHDRIMAYLEQGGFDETPLEDLDEAGFQDIEPMTLREWDARIQELKDWLNNGGQL